MPNGEKVVLQPFGITDKPLQEFFPPCVFVLILNRATIIASATQNPAIINGLQIVFEKILLEAGVVMRFVPK
ncbi:hypothetical protein JW998_01590 [candidate division KSB1 bacterium]|nr:hypothetical protein [candidate division KSB1 bacterium]